MFPSWNSCIHFRRSDPCFLFADSMVAHQVRTVNTLAVEGWEGYLHPDSPSRRLSSTPQYHLSEYSRLITLPSDFRVSLWMSSLKLIEIHWYLTMSQLPVSSIYKDSKILLQFLSYPQQSQQFVRQICYESLHRLWTLPKLKTDIVVRMWIIYSKRKKRLQHLCLQPL